MSIKTLIYIAGPTGVGKTKLSLEIAKLFDTDIISCDSRQFYKEMNIGTAVPTSEELNEVQHHLIQHKSIHDKYTVGDFEKEAIKTLDFLFKKKDNSSIPLSEAYDLLGIDENASIDNINKAHKELITRLHPDKGGSSYLSARINEARDIIMNERMNRGQKGER